MSELKYDPAAIRQALREQRLKKAVRAVLVHLDQYDSKLCQKDGLGMTRTIPRKIAKKKNETNL